MQTAVVCTVDRGTVDRATACIATRSISQQYQVHIAQQQQTYHSLQHQPWPCGQTLATNLTPQAGSLSSAAHLRGTALNVRAPRVVRASVQTQVLAQQFEERFRLDNLAPEPGARRKKQRVGRGYGAGQVRGRMDV